ncbi:hypothetical protein BCR43DRAFT_497020 [Syncephalastrum racemosum]|uniref:BHLH domain-containing protein n=1 Tax=Syncephalastrum racemosum TaxID=13706 RepID=A0A1X2H508_SYNRA|nr:hypothetical protein BCR43DRAFT_497020 [Syncephalastrum racemosum]
MMSQAIATNHDDLDPMKGSLSSSGSIPQSTNNDLPSVQLSQQPPPQQQQQPAIQSAGNTAQPASASEAPVAANQAQAAKWVSMNTPPLPTPASTSSSTSTAAIAPPPLNTNTQDQKGDEQPNSVSPAQPSGESGCDDEDARSPSKSDKPMVGTAEWHRIRRENHKQVERRRRETINEGINALAAIVPNCEKNKGQILRSAAEYIQQLKENEAKVLEKWTLEKLCCEQAINELTEQVEKLKEENARLRNPPPTLLKAEAERDDVKVGRKRRLEADHDTQQ